MRCGAARRVPATRGKEIQRMIAGFEKPFPAKENEMAKKGKQKGYKSF